MQAWQDLVNTALAGTERQAFRLPATEGAVADLLTEIDPSAPESALLRRAAVLATWRRAGKLPLHVVPASLEPALPDDLPCCDPQVTQCLVTLLSGKHRPLLKEWFEQVAAAGNRVPEALLPEVLELGRSNRELRAPIQAVLGRRGRWLAVQNRQWSYVAGEIEEDSPSAWGLGSRETRTAYLVRLREREPARARELLAGVWSQEAARERSAFLETLRISLSLEDEPFLEAALDDRSKEVRTVAADLLSRLPESRLVARITERLTPLLALQRSELVKWKLEVTLPDTFSKELARDGIEEKPPHGRGVGKKQWWLIQMLSTVPASVWCRHWNREPLQLLDAAAHNSEWEFALLEGWSRAAHRFQEADWAEVLVTRWAMRLKQGAKTTYFGCAEVLPADRLEQCTLQVLEASRGSLDHSHPVFEMLTRCKRPWSVELTRAVLDRLRRNPRDLYALEDLPVCIPEALFEEALTGWPEKKDWQAGTINNFHAAVEFRREMLEAIRKL